MKKFACLLNKKKVKLIKLNIEKEKKQKKNIYNTYNYNWTYM